MFLYDHVNFPPEGDLPIMIFIWDDGDLSLKSALDRFRQELSKLVDGLVGIFNFVMWVCLLLGFCCLGSTRINSSSGSSVETYRYRHRAN